MSGCPCCYTIDPSQGPANVLPMAPNGFGIALSDFLCANSYISAPGGGVQDVLPWNPGAAAGQQVRGMYLQILYHACNACTYHSMFQVV